MKRESWIGLSPSLLAGAGIIVATLMAMLTAESGWWILAAPLLLAMAFVGAEMLGFRLKGMPPRPSMSALVYGGAILMAGGIVTLRDPSLVKVLIPVIGPGFWIALAIRSDAGRTVCRHL